MTEPLPLDGIKVFDATQGVAGPHSTMLLAQYGADVTKLEPLDGDWGRTLGKPYGDHCAHSIAFNRGKKSIALDLKHPDGVKAAQTLAAQADVFVESFRPDVMKRFGLSYDDIKAKNPEIIYLSVTGFGQDGPNRTLPVTDSVIQAFSGFMTVNKDARGMPQRIGMVAIDVMTGVYAYQAIATALIRKFRFGKGAYIDCSLMQTAAAFQSAKIMEHYLEGGEPQALYVPVGTMETSDGFINVTAMREHHYISLCEAMGRDDMATNPNYQGRQARLDHQDEIMAEVRKEFVKKSTAQWAAELTEAGVMNCPVSTFDDYLANDHVAAIEGVSWIDHPTVGKVPIANIPGLPKVSEMPAPLQMTQHLGEQTRDILLAAGYTADAVEALLADKAAVQWNG